MMVWSNIVGPVVKPINNGAITLTSSIRSLTPALHQNNLT
jgi:hypothetical protein